MAAKGDNSRQKPTRWKPLTIEHQNAIDLLILGQTDQEVADIVGVTRPTVPEWRNQHPYFQSDPQRRRAEVWRSATEKLRSGLSKAVHNLLAAVEAGDLKASLELLKCCNIYGDGHMNAIHDRGPEGNLQYLIDRRIAAEGIPKTEHDAMAGMLALPTTAYRAREQAIRAELAAEYLEPDA